MPRTSARASSGACSVLFSCTGLPVLTVLCSKDLAEDPAFQWCTANIYKYLGDTEQDIKLRAGIFTLRSHRPRCTARYSHIFSAVLPVRAASPSFASWRSLWSGVYQRVACHRPSSGRCQACPSKCQASPPKRGGMSKLGIHQPFTQRSPEVCHVCYIPSSLPFPQSDPN